MVRTTQLTTTGPFAKPVHPATVALLAGAALLTRWAGRLEQQAQARARHVPRREVVLQQVRGESGAAVFEDGKLVGWLPGVRSL